MTWFRVDDTFAFHPKVMAAGNAAAGLWVRSGSWASQQLTDGAVTTGVARSIGTAAEAKRLTDIGLWLDAPGGGYQFHQWSPTNPTREEVVADRASNARRQALSRDVELRDQIRMRDNDRCRYCGQLVDFKDRRGRSGGTYDHIDPDGPNTLFNLVVACRGCNSSKGHRTPEQARMTLLEPKSYLGQV